jgi:hypothetical protein
MGGSIYTKKQTLDVSPIEPDFTAEKMVQSELGDIKTTLQNQELFAQKQKENQELFAQKQKEKQEAFEEKQQQKDIDFINQLNKKQVNAILDIGSTSYPDDIEGFSKYYQENISKIANNITDEKEKIKLLSEATIAYSVKEATILKKSADKKAKAYYSLIKENTLSSLDSDIDGLSNIFTINDNNISPDNKKAQESAFIDASIQLKRAYDMKDERDDNGNYVFTEAERKTINDTYENRAKDALLKYTSDNIEDNREGVLNTYNYLKDNRNEVMERYGLDSKEYDNTISKMDSIIKKESTYDIMKTEAMFKSQIEIYDIKYGEAKEGTNDSDILNTIIKLQDNYSNKLVSKEFYIDNTEKLKQAYVNYEKPKVKKRLFRKVEEPQTNVKDVVKSSSFGVCDALGDSYIDDSTRFDVEMEILNKFNDSGGIDINSAGFQDLDRVKNLVKTITPKLYKQVYSDASLFSDEQLLQKDVQDFIKQAYRERRSIDKTKAIVGLGTNKEIKEKLSGFNTGRN